MEPCVFTRKEINIIIINLSKVNIGEMEKYSNVTLGWNKFLTFAPPSLPFAPALFLILQLHTELIRLKCWEGDFSNMTSLAAIPAHLSHP